MLLDNFKQLADFISKANATTLLIKTPNVPESNNFILPKEVLDGKPNNKSKSSNMKSRNSKVLEPISKYFEPEFEKNQETDTIKFQ